MTDIKRNMISKRIVSGPAAMLLAVVACLMAFLRMPLTVYADEGVTSVLGIVEWNDNNDAEGMRPEYVTLTLLADQVPLSSGLAVTAGEYGLWTFSSGDLPVYKVDGETEISYSISAQSVPGYSQPVIEALGNNCFRITYTLDKPVLKITAKDQHYVYTGETQGPGDLALDDPEGIAEWVTADGLKEGDNLTGIQIDGQGTEIGEYDLTPQSATVNDVPASERYVVTYIKGTLYITAPKKPDDDKPKPAGGRDVTGTYNTYAMGTYGTDEAPSDDSAPKDEEPYDYLNELRSKLKLAKDLGGERTVTWDKGTALPYDIMKMLEDNPNITLVFSYTYQGRSYKVNLSGKYVKAYESILWYGPLYLYDNYGSYDAAKPVGTADTAEGTRTYTVISGDTLSEIARKLGTDVDNLIRLNDIRDPDFIRTGWMLRY